jgi:hypothetical protein
MASVSTAFITDLHICTLPRWLYVRWEELRDSREMEDYTMAICTDVGKKKGVVPGAKSARFVLDLLTWLCAQQLLALSLTMAWRSYAHV